MKLSFYLKWALFFLLITLIAFAPRYWFPLMDSEVYISTTIHWHAFFCTGWIILFIFQSLLIKKKTYKAHMISGWMSIIIFIGIIISGVWVSMGLVEKALVSNPAGAKPSLLINLSDLAIFSVIYVLGILNRNRRLIHKRMMTLATLALLNAGFFRIGRFIIGPGFQSILLAIIITSCVMALYVWTEKRKNHGSIRWLKRATISIIIIYIIRIPIAISSAWTSVADFLIDLFLV